MTGSRRQFLQRSGLALSFIVGGRLVMLSPGEARARELPYAVLSSAEVSTLEELAEALVPGARSAGVAHFIDRQLAAEPADCLLMLKYLGVPPSGFIDFYRAALGSAAALADARFGRGWPALEAAETGELVAMIAGDAVPDWAGPPASFVFFVLRSDACDVVYGTRAGFERIGMPYMAHIEPTADW
jgi:hypothetical protein